MPNASQQTFLRNPNVYQGRIRQLLKASVWNRTKLTLNTTAIAAKIQAEFPELADVAVSVPLVNRRPIVELAPAPPALLLASQGTTYVLDFRGRAIIKGSDAFHLQTSGLPLLTDQTNVPVQLGKSVLLSTDIIFIRQLIAQLKAKGLIVQSLALPATPNELQMRLASQPYYVKFDMLGDARLQAGTLLAVKARLDANHQIPSEYIDVRVEERAYYK